MVNEWPPFRCDGVVAFIDDFFKLTKPNSLSGDGEDVAPELRLDELGLTFVSK